MAQQIFNFGDLINGDKGLYLTLIYWTLILHYLCIIFKLINVTTHLKTFSYLLINALKSKQNEFQCENIFIMCI